ncbi:MAG: beta-ketoacyl synthase chain length factor, partial [Candidatus Fibromonas sp.]|nr:beta-ketoacyl synthase chain length factor [Candidatus Fibromonas sp.]
MTDKAYITKWCFWSPGKGSAESPPLPFVSPMVKRRLSQLSRMALYAIHEVSQGKQNIKITFSSEYGEITQQ